MELINTTMYHFRNGDRFNQNWIVGNEFTVDNSYKNYICNDIIPIDPNLSDIEKKIEYYSMLRTEESEFVVGEKMLELYRSCNNPDLISRINCMFFCDAESLEFWRHKLPTEFTLYEVELNGEAFKSSTLLFPFASKSTTYEEFLSLCSEYWNPDFSDTSLNECSEYLFQGSVLVKNKISSSRIRNKHNI